MKNTFVAAALSLVVASAASAATNSGTLTVTGTVESSIVLKIQSAGGSTSGTGTGAVTSGLDNISKYSGSIPSNFSRTQGASDWTLSSSIGVRVDKANLTSTDYTLTAQLNSAPASGVVWKLSGSTLSNSSPTTLTATGAYGQTDPYNWDIVIADSAAAGAINNAIVFSATSN